MQFRQEPWVCVRVNVCVCVCRLSETWTACIRHQEGDFKRGKIITNIIIFIILLFHWENLFARAREQEDQIRVVKLFVQAAYEGEEGVTYTIIECVFFPLVLMILFTTLLIISTKNIRGKLEHTCRDLRKASGYAYGLTYDLNSTQVEWVCCLV